MAVDPSKFIQFNVADTCAIWNILSSQLLYRVARAAGCAFCCTSFVHYECLFKPRKTYDARDQELQLRLKTTLQQKEIQAYSIDIADLQDVMVLESRKRVSKGELSSIAFAKKTRQAFITDDQGARKLAERSLDFPMVQTTPHLFGWLFFTAQLVDADKKTIVEQHNEMGRPLQAHFEEMYRTALAYRLMASPPATASNA
jgi:predicted nucleic acid-binding protein